MKKILKSNDFVDAYSRFLPFVKPYIFLAILGILLTVPVGALDAAIAWFLKPFMDNVMVNKNDEFADLVPFIIVGFTVLQGSLIYLSAIVNGYVGNKVTLDIRRVLYHKLINMDSAYYDKNNSGFIIFRYFNDADMAAGGLINNLKLFLTKFFSSLALVITLFVSSWQLALVGICVLFVLVVPLRIVRKKIKDILTKTFTESAFILTLYNETFGGAKVIKSYALKNKMYEKFEDSAGFLFTLCMRLIKETNWLSPSMHIVSSIGVAIVIWYGGSLITLGEENGGITPGTFVQFLTALIMLYTPLKSIGNNYIEVQKSIVALDRIYEIFNTKSEEEIEQEEGKIKPKLELTELDDSGIIFKDLYFGYDAKKFVLKNINLTIKKSTTVAFVGNSGGGKSTICSLLPRLYTHTKGDIIINGHSIKDYKLQSLRENIAYVFQDNFLFDGTLKDNIIMGKFDATDEEINNAIKNACLDEFVKSLPNGINTQIGERGTLLSGGQKQRVAIARAFIKNAPIVILDEATSALDNRSEKVVQKALDNLMKDRTVLVIAHRLSTIQNANEIFVINDGEIVENGNHEQLIAKQGAYSALYNSVLAVAKEQTPESENIDPDKLIDQETEEEASEKKINKKAMEELKKSFRSSIKH